MPHGFNCKTVVKVSTVKELSSIKLIENTVIDAKSLLNAEWKSVIPKLATFLLSEKLLVLIVPAENILEIVQRTKTELLKLFFEKYGRTIRIHDKEFSLTSVVRFDALLGKLICTNSVKNATKKFRPFINSLHDVNQIYDMAPHIESLLAHAYKRIKKRRQIGAEIKKIQSSGEKQSQPVARNDHETGVTASQSNDELMPTYSKQTANAPTESKASDGKEVLPVHSRRTPKSGKVRKLLSKVMPQPSPESYKNVKDKSDDDEIEKQESYTVLFEEKKDKTKCYICKNVYEIMKEPSVSTEWYQTMCKPCADLCFKMRSIRCDLSKKYAVVTGGRLKIGYEVVLKLLRDGCFVVATTRFPHDAAERYCKESDYDQWCDRLQIYSLDLLDIPSVYCFVEHLKSKLPYLDILINNAAQTISRPPDFYKHMLPTESVPRHMLDMKQRRLLVPDVTLTYCLPSFYNESKPLKRTAAMPDSPTKKLKLNTSSCNDLSSDLLEQFKTTNTSERYVVTFPTTPEDVFQPPTFVKDASFRVRSSSEELSGLEKVAVTSQTTTSSHFSNTSSDKSDTSKVVLKESSNHLRCSSETVVSVSQNPFDTLPSSSPLRHETSVTFPSTSNTSSTFAISTASLPTPSVLTPTPFIDSQSTGSPTLLTVPPLSGSQTCSLGQSTLSYASSAISSVPSSSLSFVSTSLPSSSSSTAKPGANLSFSLDGSVMTSSNEDPSPPAELSSPTTTKDEIDNLLPSTSGSSTSSKLHINMDASSFPKGAYDNDGQQIDLRTFNSWKYTLCDVPLREMTNVLTINALGPFILTSQLKSLLKKSPSTRKFIVNVSAMEGQFHRTYKSEFHPHTNMAKAALNMMTRTSGIEYQFDGIFMTAVDTGWVTDERPFQQARHEENKGFKVPLDCVDGAARIYHPIVHGLDPEQTPYFAVFLKDYKPSPW